MKQYFAFQWHITDECDQRCKHCYIFSENNCKKLDSMTWQQMQKTFDNCLDFCRTYDRLPYFYITGGDPILHPDFWRLLGLMKEHEIPFTILGNPFHLSDDVCLRLKELGCEKYQLSLDGMHKTHDWFRKPGSFEITLEKIGCINRAGIRSVIMTTVSGTNIDEIPDIIDAVVKAGANVFAFATTDAEGSPQVRNISAIHYEPDTIYFFTARGKDFCRELLRDGRVQILAYTRYKEMIRLSARAVPVPGEDQKRWIDTIFSEQPYLSNVYPGDTREIGIVFKITDGQIEYFNLGVRPIFRESYPFGKGTVRPKGYQITDACIDCGTCSAHCPQDCIVRGEPFQIRQEHCLHCGSCFENCPVNAVIRRTE